MMGQHDRTESLFYYFRLEDQIPEDHLLRLIDHQTDGHFTHDQFRYEPAENAYYCPEGKMLSYKGHRRDSHGYLYRSTEAQCMNCPQKKRCTSGFIADCLYTSKSLSGKPSVLSPERQPTSGHGGLATKSKLCLLNSSSECACIECDYVACGT